MPLPTSEQLLKNENNTLLEKIRELDKRLKLVERRPAARTNFTNAAGAHVIVGTGDPFNIENPFTGTAILYPAYADTAGNFHIFGMNAGVVQWGANSDDGQLYAGGGDVIINQYGILFRNQEGELIFQDTAGGSTISLYSDEDDYLSLSNAFGGTGVRFYIDDATHNVRVHTIDYDGVDLQAGATYEIGGIDITTGWLPVSETWTRTGNHTFTVAGDRTTVFRKGTKVMYYDGAYDFGVVASSVFGALTTITLITNTDYAMAATTITDTRVSYIANPESFPHWFNWAASPTGYSAVPASPFYKWSTQGRTITVSYVEGNNGTSNATTTTATAPVAPIIDYSTPLGATVDNGTLQTTPGRMVLSSGSTTITFRKDSANGAWTNANGKRCVGIAVYEF